MKKWRVAIGCVASALTMTAAVAEPRIETPGHDPVLAEFGEPLFTRHCAACHGRSGRGDGPAGEALRKAPADLTTIAARRDGVFPTTIARFIDGRFDLPAHGSRDMPIWGRRFGIDVPEADIGESIARGQIASLVEYLKSIQREADAD